LDDELLQPVEEDEKTKRIKQLNRTVCICNGIKLARVLKALEGSETVADVNRKAGTGCGGCKGERCGPRIKMLLKKKKDLEKANVETDEGPEAESEA
jgi:NAD(P)H-nitrite reductase large subunit